MGSDARERTPEEWFFYLLFQTIRRRDQAFGDTLDALGLNMPKWRTLSVISRLSGCTMNELAEFTTIDRPTPTRTRSEEHTSDLQSPMRHACSVFCLTTNT